MMIIIMIIIMIMITIFIVIIFRRDRLAVRPSQQVTNGLGVTAARQK